MNKTVNAILNATRTIETNKGTMTIKEFIWNSCCFDKDGSIILPLNKKTRLVSNGEGGNRHFSVEVLKNENWVEAMHLWYDCHGVGWCSVRKETGTSRRLEKTVIWCIAKNGNMMKNYTDTWNIRHEDRMVKIIIDLMTYIR